MFTTTRFRHLVWGALVLGASHAQGQATVPGNAGTATDFLGWDNIGPNNFPLQVRHDLNQPIEWYTNAVRRMLMNPTTSYTIGSFVNQAKDGAVLLSPNVDQFYTTTGPGPYSLMHLAASDNNAQQSSYRDWMDVGVTFTGNADHGYVGQKVAKESILDYTDMVLHWSDNPSKFLKDRLRFIFTSGYNINDQTGASSLEGLEGMRLYPVDNDNVNVGIGDWHAANVNDPLITEPEERLDVVDGRLRIRELPEASGEAMGTYKVMVVDDAASPSGERGVVKWVDPLDLPPTGGTGGGDCDWVINTAANRLTTAFEPVNSNGPCPEADWRVGIGVTAPQAKFHVDRTFTTEGGGENMTGYFRARGVQSSGGKVALRALTEGEGWEHWGVQSIVSNGATTNRALQGVARVQSGFTTVNNRAVDASSEVNAGASSTNNTAVEAYSLAAGTATNSFALRAVSQASGSVVNNYGVYGQGRGTGALASYGVYGTANASTSQFRCGVFGTSPVVYDPDAFEGSWAGYFDGIVRISGNAYVNGNILVSSDESLKTNVEELGEVGERLAQLTPITYDFVQHEHPHMDLPPGLQIGLGAQQVREVFPELVEEVPVPALYDSTGAQIASATSHLAVNYTGLIPVLIAAVQEQQDQLESAAATETELQDRLAVQEARGDELAARLDQLEQALALCCSRIDPSQSPLAPEEDLKIDLGGDRLLRIDPNPFTDRTTIRYTLERGGRTMLLVNSSDGKQLQVLGEAVQQAGDYQQEWHTSHLAPGIYYVTLLLDGESLVKRAVKVN